MWSIAYQDVDGRLRRERTNAKTKTLSERILADRQDFVERARLQGLPTVDDLLRPAPAVTLRAVLEAQPRHVGKDPEGKPLASPYVFTSPDTGTRYERFNNTTCRKALAAAGIKSFHWHDLRHTFGSRLAQRGASPIAIKELMGHSDLRVTTRYTHLAPANLWAAVALLDEPRERAVTTPLATPSKIDTRKEAV